MKRGTVVVSAILFPLILLATVWALVVHHHPSGELIRAQFDDVGLLVPGDDVRIAGATSGSVDSITLTGHGTAMVTIALKRGLPALRADATASVRDEDLLGDTYLELDRGTSPSPLSGPIPVSHTFVATRVQDMFNSFNQPTRTALRALILEVGTALDDRGADLNSAVLQLAPAFGALQKISDQLSSQSAQLESTITSVDKVTAEVAPRSRDLQRLITGLRQTFDVTASRTGALKAGLSGLPTTLSDLTVSLDAVQSTATSSEPAAADLEAVAPQLDAALKELTPFTRDAIPAVHHLDSLIGLTRRVLIAGRRSFPRLRTTLATTLADAPALRSFSTMINPYVTYMVTGLFAGLGQLAAEPGTTSSPNSQPDRNVFRSELMLDCEMFGVPVAPGCMTTVLDDMSSSTASSTTAAPTTASGTTTTTPSAAASTGSGATSTTTTQTTPTLTVPQLHLPTVTVPGVKTPVTAPTTTTPLSSLLGYLLNG